MSTKTACTDRRIVVEFDYEARAQYQCMSDKPIVGTIERDGQYVDLAADGTVVGIETLFPLAES